MSLIVAMMLASSLSLAESKAPKPGKLKRKLPNLLKQLKKERYDGIATSPSDFGLSGGSKLDNPFSSRFRVSVSPNSPHFARQPAVQDEKEFQPYIIEPADDDGWFIFSRFNPGRGHDYTGTQYLVRRFTETFEEKFKILLNRHLLYRNTEVQDARFLNGKVYYNEACGSYSSGYKGKCSHLACLDPVSDVVVWRTPNLVSNNIFIFKDDDTIIAGYGFTDEPDHLFLISAVDGKVLSRTKLDSAHTYLELKGGKLHVFTHKSHYVFGFRKLPAARAFPTASCGDRPRTR